MGRPPIGKVAMTSTERVHRFRLKHRAEKLLTILGPASADDPPEARVRKLEAALKREMVAHTRTLAMLETERAQYRKKVLAFTEMIRQQRAKWVKIDAEVARLKKERRR
jgi:hypothetical protein